MGLEVIKTPVRSPKAPGRQQIGQKVQPKQVKFYHRPMSSGLVSSLQNWPQFNAFQVTPVIFAEDSQKNRQSNRIGASTSPALGTCFRTTFQPAPDGLGSSRKSLLLRDSPPLTTKAQTYT
jgi:hypothetical protein